MTVEQAVNIGIMAVGSLIWFFFGVSVGKDRESRKKTSAVDRLIDAERQLDSIRALHCPIVDSLTGKRACAHSHCRDDFGYGDSSEWPCPTIRALDGGDET